MMHAQCRFCKGVMWGGLCRRLVDDNHPVHALLFNFCILLHTSSPSSALLALRRWLDVLLCRFRDWREGEKERNEMEMATDMQTDENARTKY